MTTKHSVTRRTALAGVAAGTLIPGAGLAQAATTPNATDAAWAEYRAARAADDATQRAYDAFDETLPEHLKGRAHPSSNPAWDGPDWRRAVEAYNRAREEIGADAFAEACDQSSDRVCGAARALRDTPAETLVDVERKLTAILDFEDDAEHDEIEEAVAVLRAVNGRAAS